jgi:hypothetical protein
MNMPPRWGSSSFGLGGYNDVAPPELKSGSWPAARTTALTQWVQLEFCAKPQRKRIRF